MLLSLEIRDMLIIDHLELEFHPGLNVLTGETGAGKSILLDALGFVLGWRGRADLVRSGALLGEVTAVFELEASHPARTVLHEAGIDIENELILRRTSTPDGRKTARVNDRRASAEVLRALSSSLVELHGQQDDKGLLDARTHGKILDEYGGLQSDLDQVKHAWHLMRAARRALEDAQAALAKIREEEEYLRHAADELETLDPQVGEEETLDAKRRMMQAAQRIGGDISKADAALGPSGAEGTLLDAQRWLEGVAAQAEGQLDAPLLALSRALNELAHAQQGVEAGLRALTHDPALLETAEERLFAIRAMARKHEVTSADLPGLINRLRDKLDAIDEGDSQIEALDAALSKAQRSYQVKAEALSKKRHGAGKRLDRAMAGELTPLRLERAVFTTVITPGDPGPGGIDAIRFEVATNPGAPSGAINKIASGGELSRFLLALKVCLTKDASGITMIFDEIDRGVGGATADAVGRRLLQVAQRTQVLVVTHSPQVAAQGQHHWRVEKSVRGGVTLSRVVPLDDLARVDELARMLAGDTITLEARGAARALLGQPH